jgi:TfoX/Sxy family transcriptional regulator of competence genes
LDPEFIRELFAQFGPVTVRRMFNSVGIFADGMMIGLINKETIYLKTDATSAADFEREGVKAIQLYPRQRRPKGRSRGVAVLALAGTALRRSRRACRVGPTGV